MPWRALGSLRGSERAFTPHIDELITIKGSLVRLLDSIVARLPFVLAGLVSLMISKSEPLK
jgi:hypothetical protein